VTPSEAQKLVNQKTQRPYTSAKQDILEASLRHLQDAADIYDLLSRDAPWITIECFDSSRRAMRAPQDIARDVWAAVQPAVASQVATQPGAGRR
jgi:hypothetical protein